MEALTKGRRPPKIGQRKVESGTARLVLASCFRPIVSPRWVAYFLSLPGSGRFPCVVCLPSLGSCGLLLVLGSSRLSGTTKSQSSETNVLGTSFFFRHGIFHLLADLVLVFYGYIVNIQGLPRAIGMDAAHYLLHRRPGHGQHK